jgi:hypothetical protein
MLYGLPLYRVLKLLSVWIGWLSDDVSAGDDVWFASVSRVEAVKCMDWIAV